MQARSAVTTIANFIFRFAALMLLTIVVLSSVSVRASRDDGARATPPVAQQTAPGTAAHGDPVVVTEAATRR